MTGRFDAGDPAPASWNRRSATSPSEDVVPSARVRSEFLEAEHLEQFQAFAALVVGGGEHHQSLLAVESDERLAVQDQAAHLRVDHGLAIRSFDCHLVLGPHPAEAAAHRLQPCDEHGDGRIAGAPAGSRAQVGHEFAGVAFVLLGRVRGADSGIGEPAVHEIAPVAGECGPVAHQQQGRPVLGEDLPQVGQHHRGRVGERSSMRTRPARAGWAGSSAGGDRWPARWNRWVDVSAARSVPRAVVAPIAALMDGGARLLHRRTPPPVTNWTVAAVGRDRSYDITAARTDLGYRPRIGLDAGLREMAPRPALDSGSA